MDASHALRHFRGPGRRRRLRSHRRTTASKQVHETTAAGGRRRSKMTFECRLAPLLAAAIGHPLFLNSAHGVEALLGVHLATF